jgi:integrase/recombinase XerD
MLKVYRRHSEDCPNSSDRYWRRCRCPVWAEGTVEGVYRRKTLKTRSWERATELVRAIEDGKKTEQPDPLTIMKAVDSFLADAEQGRKLREAAFSHRRMSLN